MEWLSGNHAGCRHDDPNVGCVCSDVWVPIDVAASLRTADMEEMGRGRAEGLHLGRIIHEAKRAAGESVDDVPGDQPSVRVQEGFLWETIAEYVIAGAPVDEAIELAFKRYMLHLRAGVVKQISVHRDEPVLGRIVGTPDALDASVPQLESYKSTRRTLRNARTPSAFESNFWTWVMQEGGYAYMAGVQQVRWIVWWQAGDYGRPLSPRMLEATARYSDAELEANWRGICAIAERLRRAA